MEKDEAAANAFKLNYPNSTVLSDDCNMILRLVMDVRGREEGEREGEGGRREERGRSKGRHDVVNTHCICHACVLHVTIGGGNQQLWSVVAKEG